MKKIVIEKKPVAAVAGLINMESTYQSSRINPALINFFIDELKSVYWAEKHLVANLPKMEKAATSPELAIAIADHLEETKGHVERLEAIFSLLGKKPQAKKCDAMEGLAKNGEGVIEDTGNGTITRDVGIILASQKVAYHEMAAYEGLSKLAITIGLTAVSELLSQTLREEKNANETLASIAENDIDYEAAEEE